MRDGHREGPPAHARAADNAAPAELLCASSQIEERGRAWVWSVLQHGRPVRAFALRFESTVRAYLNRCVHVPTEMDWQPGEFLDRDHRFILCSMHGATYEPRDGHCVGGPCGNGRLTPITVRERDGQVYWYPCPDIRPLPHETPLAWPADESPP